MNSPLRYFGGKSTLAGYIRRYLLPDGYRHYIEPFFGGGGLFFSLSPADVETVNDLDGELVNFYRVLQDANLFRRFQRIVELTPFSRQVFAEARQKSDDPVQQAVNLFVRSRQAFGGTGSWGSVITDTMSGVTGSAARWLAAVRGLPEAHQRLSRVQIEHDDGISVIQRYATAESFVYADPPYTHDTRRGNRYRHEMLSADHDRMVGVLLSCPGRVMLSGYRTPLYRRLETGGFHRIDIPTVSHIDPSRGKRCESLWINYTVSQMEFDFDDPGHDEFAAVSHTGSDIQPQGVQADSCRGGRDFNEEER